MNIRKVSLFVYSGFNLSGLDAEYNHISAENKSN